MDPPKRTRSHTIPANVQGLNAEFNKSLDSVSKEPNTNNRTSLQPGSPPPVNNPSGKSWIKFFGGQHTKQSSSETSNNCPELDLSYITPRLIVMTTPRDNLSDVSSRSTAELINNLLNTKHPNSYMIYTLDQPSSDQISYQKELFHNRVIDLPLFDEKQSPRLIVLLWFCQKITSYLLESPSNVVVLHCVDESNQLAFGTCLLLACHKIFSRVDQIIQYYQSKRCLNIFLTMSQKRYIQYLCDLSFDVIEQPHFNELILAGIHLSPVPLVNRQKTGCRPFVDIYDQDNNKIFSTYQETAKLKVYSALDSHCLIPIDLPFNGDLTIHITHATIGHLRQTHEGGIRICELTINSNFSTSNHPELSYLRNELDGIELNDKNPTLFRVAIQITHLQKPTLNRNDSFTELLIKTLKQPLALFEDENDLQKTIKNYSKIEVPASLPSVIPHRRKSKDESTSSNSMDPSSPQNNNPISSGFSPQSISSFVNPRHTLFKQQIEANQRQSPLIEENQNKTKFGTLLDFGDEDFNTERSFSSDQQQRECNSSLDSRTNLPNDNDFNSKKNSTQIIFPTTILKPEQKSSPSTGQSNTTPTTNTPNYNVNILTSKTPSPQTQSNPVRRNPPPKPKIDIYQYFNEVGVVNKDSKPPPVPIIPNTIGAARKATLDKDVDPTILKIREWTDGKTRNLRALLCSLSNITWPECGWTGCQMNELITDDQVKKAYRKAVLYIHPDKLRGDPNEALAKLIFLELNEAWSQFEKESN